LHRATQSSRRQLQRFVMTTIRVMAWHQRAMPTAHATRTTPGKKPFGSKLRAAQRLSQERSCVNNMSAIKVREHPIPADLSRAIT
jgi:hypothetical protein